MAINPLLSSASDDLLGDQLRDQTNDELEKRRKMQKQVKEPGVFGSQQSAAQMLSPVPGSGTGGAMSGVSRPAGGGSSVPTLFG